jgi:hypothetical protein
MPRWISLPVLIGFAGDLGKVALALVVNSRRPEDTSGPLAPR